MFSSLTTYVNAVYRSWHAQDRELISALISLRDRHATNHHLQVEHPDNVVLDRLDSPIDEIVNEHIKVLYYLSKSRKCLFTQKPKL